MGFDFVVDWQGTEEATSEEVIRHIFCKRLDAGLPSIVAFVGGSRTGKTMWALKLQEVIYNYYGLNFANYVKQVVMIKSKDWTEKIEPILREESPELKKIKSIHLDEAKFTVSTDDWQKTKNKALRAIIGTGAVIQPMVIIIIAQLRSDIDSRIRTSLNYMFEVQRTPGKKPVIACKIPYEIMYDLNNIKIKTRELHGIIKYPNDTHETVYLRFTPSMPSQEVREIYWQFEKEDKKEQLLKILKEVKEENKKLSGSEKEILSLVDFLIENPNELELAGKWGRDSWKFSKNAKNKFNRDLQDLKEVERLITERLSIKKKDVVSNGVAATE